jgi:UDP-glucose 4-epimerase
MGEAGVIAIFARRILIHEPVRIDWDGEQQKDYVYVGDVARANLLAVTAGDSEAYCIASGMGTSVNALYRALVKEIGHEVQIVRAPKRPGDVYLTYFDCSKADRELGWKADVSLEEGMRLTVNYFSEKLLKERGAHVQDAAAEMTTHRLRQEPLAPAAPPAL